MSKLEDVGIPKPIWRCWRDEFLAMEKDYDDNKLESALEHEKKALEYMSFITFPTVLEECQYDFHVSKKTQLKHPFRKKKGAYAAALAALEKEERDTGYIDYD